MADSTYQPKVYRNQGGDIVTVASGGVVNMETGSIMKANGTQASALAVLSISVGTADDTLADVGGAFNQTTLNDNFADVGTKINAIINALKGVGILP